jgi:hypothetical protein
MTTPNSVEQVGLEPLSPISDRDVARARAMAEFDGLLQRVAKAKKPHSESSEGQPGRAITASIPMLSSWITDGSLPKRCSANARQDDRRLIAICLVRLLAPCRLSGDVNHDFHCTSLHRRGVRHDLYKELSISVSDQT